nr:MAG TPA: hypothetical protein [Bacteriophage sp.]
MRIITSLICFLEPLVSQNNCSLSEVYINCPFEIATLAN